MAIKPSSLLLESVKKVAREMLKNSIQESELPGMPSFHISLTHEIPDGYHYIWEFEEEGTKFFLTQKL